MLEATRNFIEDTDQRARLVDAGRKRVKTFSWSDTAIKTLDLYKSLV
jgi:glycosyltransferase involved in cell wall biosynthesis